MSRRRRGGDRSASPPEPRPAPAAPPDAAAQPWRKLALGGEMIAFPADPLCEAEPLDPASQLLAEHAECAPGQPALLLGAGCGLLATWAARRSAPAPLILSDVHSIALDRAAATLRRNGVARARILPADQLAELAEGALAVALVNSAVQSNSRALDAALDAIGRALRPGGRIYLAGAKSSGIGAIKSRLAARFGAAATLGYRKGVHVVVATRPDAPWVAAPAAPDETIDVRVRGLDFRLALRDGVFARGGLDDGTRMLIEALDVRPADDALDLGCGGGILGMALARLAPHGQVALIDSDSSAVALARQNLAANGIGNAAVYLGDSTRADPGATFDLIATNPPFHLGRRQTTDIALQFIADAARALRPGGRFYLVANRFLPYERAFADAFGEASEAGGDGRFKVLYACVKTSHRV